MSNFIDIIIRAYDKASEVGRKVSSIYQKQGENIKKAFDNARKADELFKKSVEDMAQSGQQSFNQLTNAQQRYYTQTSKTESYNKKLGESIKTVGTNGMSAYAQINSKQQSYLESTSKSEQITRKMGLIFDDVKNKASSAWDTIKNKASSAMQSANQKVESFKGKINSLNDSLGTVGQGFTSVFGALGLGSIMDATVGLAMTREQMTTLMGATLGSADAAQTFTKKLDTMTNNSLVSLNDLGSAMNNIKMSTGMTNEQLSLVSSTVNDVGQRALLMGKDTTESQALMVASFRGLNGEFDMLKANFGISADMLKDLGWDGTAQDVEGYNEALKKALERGGSMEEMMETTPGMIQLVKKGFSSAGREIGEAFLPAIKVFLNFMVALKKSNPEVFKLVIIIGALVSGFALILPVLVPIIEGFQKFGGFLKDIPDHLKTVKDNIQKIPEIPGKVRDSFDKIKNGAKSAKDKVIDIKNSISGSWQDGKLSSIRFKFDSIKTSASSAGGKIKEMGGNLKNIVSGKLDYVKTAITNLGSSAKEAATKIWAMATAHMAAGKEALINAGNQAKAGLANAASAIKTGLLTAATWLQTAAQTALNFVMALNPIFLIVMAIAALIAILIYLYYNCEEVRNAINGLWTGIQELANIIWNSLIGAWNALLEILQPVTDFLTGIWNSIIGGGESVGGLTSVFNLLMSVLTPLWEFLVNIFKPVWDTIIIVFMIVWTHVQRIIQIFTLLLGGQISLGEALSMIWETIKSLFVTVLTTIISKVAQFAGRLWNNAVKAGSNFVKGILNYIKLLPGRLWALLLSAITKVISFASNILGKARSAGTNLVNGFINQINDLPGKVWTELMRIKDKILSAGSEFVNSAKQAAGKLKDSFLATLGIKSPGDMYRAIKGEVGYIGEALTNGKDYLKSKAQSVANSIKEGFGSPELSVNVQDIPTANNPNITNKTAENTPQIPQDTINAINNASVAIPDESLNKLTENSELTQVTVDKTSEGVLKSFTSMTKNVDKKLTDMVKKDKNSWNKVNSDTNSTLRKITSSTKSSANQMNSAWSNMKNKINNAAGNIKTQSTSHFNNLSNTISSFYGKLQNPSRWGAGGPSVGGGSRGGPSSVSSGISSLIGSIINREIKIPQTIITSTQANNLGYDNSSLDYVGLNNGLININDLMGSECLDCNILPDQQKGSGWSETASSNVQKIKNTTNNYGMKGPKLANKWPTNLSFKVKDFISGAPKISWSDFLSMANTLFSPGGPIKYQFYYDHEKYGSWLNAMNHGRMNCAHSTECLNALAESCGFSAQKVHGHWNQYGHYFSMINGHKMDATGAMGGHGWTPSQSAGPAPTDPFEKIIRLLEKEEESNSVGINTSVPNFNTTKTEILLTVKHEDQEINLNFNGNTEGINEEDLKESLKTAIADKEIIKTLLKDSNFLSSLNKALQSALSSKKIRLGVA